MPQLDPSYYISQVTWLLISFGCFFCICKFLILPQLDKTLSIRTDLIETNLKFAQEITTKAKTINEYCDKNIENNKIELNKKMSTIIKHLKDDNEKKISDLKKSLNEGENRNILHIKQEMQHINDNLKSEIVLIVNSILQKVYLIKPDESKILELYKKYQS